MKTKKSPGFGYWGLQAYTWVLLILVISPFVVVTLGAFINTSLLGISTEQWSGDSGTSSVTFHWFGYVWDLYRDTLFFSVRLATLSAVFCLFIGVPGGYMIVRHRNLATNLLEATVMLPLALPGISFSIALIQAYAVVRGSWWLILGGHLLYTMPFMVRLVTGVLRSLNLEALENTARSLGAGPWQRFFYVVLPNLRNALITGALLAFAISWGEFNVSFLLNTPLHQTYPAALYATYTSNSFQVGSAATVIFLIVLTPTLWIIQRIGGSATTCLEQGA